MTTSPQAADESAPTRSTPQRELSTHVNEIQLVGDLAAPAEIRVHPDGNEVATFRLTVRTESPPRGRPAAKSTLRSDSIDCAAVLPAIRKRLAAYAAGDTLEVNGSLRHRYWRGPAGLNSRYEVDVASLRRRRT